MVVGAHFDFDVDVDFLRVDRYAYDSRCIKKDRVLKKLCFCAPTVHTSAQESSTGTGIPRNVIPRIPKKPNFLTASKVGWN